MRILMVTPEVSPIVKVGGLADVVGSLPKALKQQGHDVRLICPFYGCITPDETWKAHDIPLQVHIGYTSHYARVWETTLPGSDVTAYFIEFNDFYDRPEVYEGPWGDHKDNDLRFAFLCRSAIDLCGWLNWTPEVFHCHDWAAALLPVMLNTEAVTPELRSVASILTIHNLSSQGYSDHRVVPWSRIPEDFYRADGLESCGAVNILKGGLYHATKITTVSPTYAAEIRSPDGGAGLDHVLRYRGADLIGILNGIDTDTWDPRYDPYLPAHFSRDDLTGKESCREALCDYFHMDSDDEAPIFGVVSRLYAQKGLDLLADIVPGILDHMRVRFCVLGAGDGGLQHRFLDFRQRFPGRFGFHVGFDEKLAHLVYGGADFFLMPSRFEPCGLGQMYAMRYGTPPVVRATGGLADTVDPYDEILGTGTGFTFFPANAGGLYHAIGNACATYYDRPEHMQQLRLEGMQRDFSWHSSAESYTDVYQWAIDDRLAAMPVEKQAE